MGDFDSYKEKASPKKKNGRNTKMPLILEVESSRKKKLEDLVERLPRAKRKFLGVNLSSYTRSFGEASNIHSFSLMRRREDRFLSYVEDAAFDDQKRYELTNKIWPKDQFYTLFKKALTEDEARYLRHLLELSLVDIHVPKRVLDLFDHLYQTRVLKKYSNKPGMPHSPLILMTGDSGTGKTESVKEAIEQTIFRNSVQVIEPKNRFVSFLKRLVPRAEKRRQKRLAEEAHSLEIDYSMITPQTVKTAMYGEGGHYFERAFFPKTPTGIRLIEDAHGVLEDPPKDQAVGTQAQNAVKTAIINALDDVIHDRRDVIVVAMTNSPDQISKEIYLRFQQHGKIVDLNEDWNIFKSNPVTRENVKEIVKIELKNPTKDANPEIFHDEKTLDEIIKKLPDIFEERDLRATPAYIRGLIAAIVERKGGILPEYLDDKFLVRDGFKDIAKNIFGTEFYRESVNQIKAEPWDEYFGSVKRNFMDAAVNRLYHGASSYKGVLLVGPPGTGKTHLVRCFLSLHNDIETISTSATKIFGKDRYIGVGLENLHKVFALSRMLSPSLLFIDEIDGLVPVRKNVSLEDKLANKVLSEISGERSFNGVFMVGTTNRLDIVEPALIRAQRLDVIKVDGKLSERETYSMIKSELRAYDTLKLKPDYIYGSIKNICQTPAEVKTVLTLLTETAKARANVSRELRRKLSEGATDAELDDFLIKNPLTVDEIIHSIGIKKEGEVTLKELINDKQTLIDLLDKAALTEKALDPDHLKTAVVRYLLNPIRKASKVLDEFLQGELSSEPQIGFVLGMAASEVRGFLAPIASTRLYKTNKEKLIVTGAVNSGDFTPDVKAGVEMMLQSANEAYSASMNYLNTFAGGLGESDIYKRLGEYMDDWSIHHQFMNPTYSGGGPSAGYALIVNTLSLLLDLPVLNDFAITGAPWSRGPSKLDVGSPVVIGGETHKTYKALEFVNRMYMPEENLNEIPLDYRAQMAELNKLALPINSIRKLVPQVFYFGEQQVRKLNDLMQLRAKQAKMEYVDEAEVGRLEKELEDIAANAIKDKLRSALHVYGSNTNLCSEGEQYL